MNQLILGIDIGLSFTKAVIYDTTGRLITEAGRETPIAINTEDISEIDMQLLWNTVCLVIKKTLEKGDIRAQSIIGVGVTGHGNGLYYVDRHGNPLGHAISPMDYRSKEELRKLIPVQDALRNMTLQNLWEGQPVLILKWLKENKPEIYEKIGAVLLCKDWITYCLTSELTGDYSDMSAASLLDNVGRKYNKKVFELLGIPEMAERMPRLLKSFEIAGHVTEAAEKQTGLKKGTPVIAGLFDVDACGLGAGLIREDQFCSIAGTWNVNISILKDHVKSERIRQCTIRGDNSCYLAIDSSPTSSSNIEWLLKNVFENKYNYTQFEDIIAGYEPAKNKIIYLPLLYGGIAGKIGGEFSGLRSFHTYKDLFTSVAEGICFAHKYHLDNLIETGSQGKTILLTGGASKLLHWTQMFADVTGFKVEIPESPQTGTLGLCISVCIGIGMYPNAEEAVKNMVRVGGSYYPDTKKHLIYQEKYNSFKEALLKV